MKLKPVLLFCGAVTLIFALGYMFLPGQTLALLGYQTDTAGTLAIQFVGVLSMGYVAAIWQVRNASREAQRPVVLSALAAMGFGFLVALFNQIRGTFGPLGWVGVGMFGLAFGVFAYFWFFKMRAD